MALCVVLLGVNLWQGKRLSELEQDIWNAQNSVMDNVSRMDQRVASLYSELESVNDLVRDWSYESAVNMEKHGLDIKVSLELKEWQEGVAVKLLCGDLNDPGRETVVPLSGDGAGAFTGTVELMPYELSGEYTLDAVIQTGDTQRRESLGWLGGTENLLPVQCASWRFSGPVYQKSTNQSGVVTLDNCDVELSGDAGAPDRIADCVFRLTRNRKTAAEQTAMQGDRMGLYGCGEISTEVQVGDVLALTLFCRDGSGLSYEFFLEGWSVQEGGLERYSPLREYPRLTWN